MKKFLLLFIFIPGFASATTQTVNWYTDDNTHNTTTCTIGGDVTLPTAPTKRGYTFNGWKFAYDFSTLDATINGTSYNVSEQIWSVVFPYGTIYGTTACVNAYRVNPSVITDISEFDDPDNNKTCWCRVTGYQPSGSNITYVPHQTLPWATTGHNSYSSVTGCINSCRSFCSGTSGYGNVMTSSTYRQALFGITQ